jgi:hypothetical protein
MPMNPRLLRPTQGGFVSPDADARAYLAAVRQADGANLEPRVAKAISDFIIGCKSDGIFSAIKSACILAGARTLNGALTPLVGTAPTNNGPFVSGDYTRGGSTPGLRGNGSTKNLDSNRANNADPQDNKHVSLYITQQASIVNASCYMACGTSVVTGVTHFSIVATGNRLVDRLNWGGSGAGANDTGTPLGLLGASRASFEDYELRLSGETSTRVPDSQTPDTNNIFVFSRNSGANASDPRIAFYSIGESLDLALLDARVSALITAIGAAIP